MTNDWQQRASKRGGQPTYWRYAVRLCKRHGEANHVEIKTSFNENLQSSGDLIAEKKQDIVLSICQKCSAEKEKKRLKRNVKALPQPNKNKANVFWYDER